MRSGRQSFKPSSGDRSRMQQLPDSADDLPESVMVNLDSKDPDAFDIVEVDDQIDDADRGQPTSLDSSIADQEADLRGLSVKTQKRIDRLKFETHTERRAREDAERQRDAAIIAARAKDDEIADLRKRMQTGTTALAGAMKSEREAKLADATRRLAAAHELGDSTAIAQATADIATATSEITNIVARGTQPREEPVPERQAPPQQSRLAPNVENWIGRNRSWFQQPGGEAKTAKAMSIHYDLLARGVQPSSADYTRELDKGLKAVYPDHQPYDFSPSSDGDGREERSAPRRTNAVAEGSRETRQSSNPRTVELTRSELSIAKRLGVSPQAYAAQKLKRMQANGEGA